MSVSMRYILSLCAVTSMSDFAAYADSKGVAFSGVVAGGGALKPARATITTFSDNAAIEMVVANTGSGTAELAMSASADAQFAPARLRLKPGRQAVVRALVLLETAATDSVSVCVVRTDAISGARLGKACARYAIRRLSLD